MSSFSRMDSSLSGVSTINGEIMEDHHHGHHQQRRLNSTVRAPSKYKSGDKILTLRRLDVWYRIVKNQILQYQSFTTGLYPRHSNDEQTAYVRDSLYCSMACWSLSLAYSRMDDDRGRQYELGQSVVKTMRGILFSWMRQSDKIEKFKKDHSPRNALHSKFHLVTGEPVVGDDAYGHLQIDVVALFLLCLVQMINGGLEIIFTSDEVSFVQNLVFYVERAYRTPDFGMWEDGTRYNDGTPELHASSVGSAKAILEAINGFNCFGSKGTTASVIYVDIDAHNRNRTIFESLLPRESASKNTDVSLIPTISFPCFATHDPKIYHRTMEKCVRRLRGPYGFKRFLRDGHYTALEDTKRRFYKAGETKLFDGIECQWPMFYLFMIIDACFSEKDEQRQKYWDLLNNCLVEGDDGSIIVPQYYFIPEECLFQERCNPGSQTMSPSTEKDDGLFLCGQSLYVIASLLSEQLLLPTEIDPIYRHVPASQRPKINTRHSVFQNDSESPEGVEEGALTDTVVQIALVAESVSLQAKLLTYGIQAQTPHQVEPVQIWPPSQLVKVCENLGKNDRLKLKGRPPRPVGALGTSKVYRVFGDTVMCYPLLFEVNDFYMSYDPAVIIDDIKKDLKFIARRWKLSGRPTFCFLLREDNVSGEYFSQMLELLVGIKNGFIDGVRVRQGRVQNLLAAACIEHLDFASFDHFSQTVRPLREVESDLKLLDIIPGISNAVCDISVDSDFSIEIHRNKSTPELVQVWRSTLPTSLYTQSRILQLFQERHGLEFKVDVSAGTVKQLLNKLCRQAALVKNWSVVRYCAASLRKTVDSLAPAVTSILVRGKRLTVGVFGHVEQTIDKPVTPDEIADYLYKTCAPYDISLAVLEQEILIALGYYTTVEPQLFSSILKIRIGWFVHAMTLLLNYENDKSIVSLTMLSPTEIKQVLRDILTMKRFNRLSNLQQRQLNGSLNRVPPDFYERLWKVMEKTPEGIIVADHLLPQQPTLSDMTEYELNFAFAIDDLLNRINQPEYRQLMVEAFMVVSLILERNPELHFVKALNMDNIILEAFGIYCKEKSISNQSDLALFYTLQWQGRLGTGAYLARAVVNVLLKDSDNALPVGNLEYSNNTQCSIS